MDRAGWMAMWLAIGAAVVVAGASALGRPRIARIGHLVLAAGGAVAVFGLAWAFATENFALSYVADHSRRDLGPLARVSGVWGGMDGSLLLYGAGLGVASLVAARRAPVRLRPVATTVGALTAGSVLAMTALLADPFTRLQVPAIDGAGLTPILEHAAMTYHPPLLYAGLTSLIAPFVLAVSAMSSRRIDREVLDQLRRWLLLTWTLLVIGMLAGAHWAYVELGWGGYWAWDPVENTALLPWLAVTAALHGLVRSEPSDRSTRSAGSGSPGWVTSLVVLAFLTSVFGALLSRSGATSSVHSFAEARSIGRAFGVLLLVLVGVSIVTAARVRGRITAPRPSRSLDRAAALAGQQVVLLASFGIVFIGSAWPLVAQLTGGEALAVEGQFFARFTGVLAVVGLGLVSIGPHLRPTPARPDGLGWTLTGTAAGAIGGVLVGGDWFATLLAAACGAAIGGAVFGLVGAAGRRGPHVAHLGVALLLFGVAGTSTGTTETVGLAVGDQVTVEGVTATNLGVRVEGAEADRSRSVVATVDVDGRIFEPELVAFPTRNTLLAESALHSTPARDVQLMLRTADDDGKILLQVGVHPFQQLVWWGALVMAAAGAWSTVEPRRTKRAGPGGGDTDHTARTATMAARLTG